MIMQIYVYINMDEKTVCSVTTTVTKYIETTTFCESFLLLPFDQC